MRYHRSPWNLAFSVAQWNNHDAIFFDDDTLVYDGFGAELFASYQYSDRWQFYGGFNYTDPDIDDPRVDSDFGVEQLLLGASVFATEESFAYFEAVLSNDKDVNGERVDSVFSRNLMAASRISCAMPSAIFSASRTAFRRRKIRTVIHQPS